MFPADNFIKTILDKRKQEDLFRSLRFSDDLIDFCSNDYLGFARSQKLKDMISAFSLIDNHHKIGSTGSRLLNGNYPFYEDLEKKITTYHKAPYGLIFNSGYDANTSILSSLPNENDTIIYDELIHASVHDGMRLSKATRFRFSHNDTIHLEEILSKAKGNIYIVVESVYSMDGDFAPLIEIVSLCNKYNANLIVDEAHATGVFEEKGRGRVSELNFEDKVFARIHTFGKAMGCNGAIILGSDLLRDYLINFARPFIYTTALPFPNLVSIHCAYDLLEESEKEIAKLKSLIELFKNKINHKNIPLINSNSPIQCIIIEGNKESKEASKKLQSLGFDVRAILGPTVPKGKERLRICLHSFNTEQEIDRLGKAIIDLF
jgi:8-amino-7-oxononanoate synthase